MGKSGNCSSVVSIDVRLLNRRNMIHSIGCVGWKGGRAAAHQWLRHRKQKKKTKIRKERSKKMQQLSLVCVSRCFPSFYFSSPPFYFVRQQPPKKDKDIFLGFMHTRYEGDDCTCIHKGLIRHAQSHMRMIYILHATTKIMPHLSSCRGVCKNYQFAEHRKKGKASATTSDSI